MVSRLVPDADMSFRERRVLRLAKAPSSRLVQLYVTGNSTECFPISLSRKVVWESDLSRQMSRDSVLENLQRSPNPNPLCEAQSAQVLSEVMNCSRTLESIF